jgi:phosphopantothenoylcysteine decarboxylase
MAKVLLGVTGSVAAIRTPELYGALRQSGHQVKVVATEAALYFFDPAALKDEKVSGRVVSGEWSEPSSPHGHDSPLTTHHSLLTSSFFRDEDEWPERLSGRRWQRDDPVLHIELRRWADLLLIAPLDANTLAKLAVGLSDNCLTCVWRAWDPARPVILAPAMNTLMWEHPLTAQHFRQLAALVSGRDVPSQIDLESLLNWINENCPKLHVVPPQSKRLACGDIGMGALADLDEILSAVKRIGHE